MERELGVAEQARKNREKWEEFAQWLNSWAWEEEGNNALENSTQETH